MNFAQRLMFKFGQWYLQRPREKDEKRGEEGCKGRKIYTRYKKEFVFW